MALALPPHPQSPPPRPDRRHEPGVATVLALLLATALTLGSTGVAASDRGDHDRARAALRAGEILPLPTLLERLQRSHPGQLLEVELERQHGQWIYEVKLLQAGGQVVKLHLDARTGELRPPRRRASEADAPTPR